MDIIEVNGQKFAVRIEHDDNTGAPWEEHDGHGVVSDWTTRDKRPGELVLVQDGIQKRYYDFAASVKKARAEGWDSAPYNIGQQTKDEQAAKAARADYARLRGWCHGNWGWVGVVVELLDKEGEGTGQTASVWGIDSESHEYHREIAKELTHEIC